MLAIEFQEYFHLFIILALVFYLLAVSFSVIFLFIGISRNKSFLKRWGVIFLFSLLVILFGFNPVLSKFVNKNQVTDVKFFSDQGEFEDYFLLVIILNKISTMATSYYSQNNFLPQYNQLEFEGLENSFISCKDKYQFEMEISHDLLIITAIPIKADEETLSISYQLKK